MWLNTTQRDLKHADGITNVGGVNRFWAHFRSETELTAYYLANLGDGRKLYGFPATFTSTGEITWSTDGPQAIADVGTGGEEISSIERTSDGHLVIYTQSGGEE